MKIRKILILALCLIPAILVLQDCADSTLEIVRPEKIVSKRIVVYDSETYRELADMWHEYFEQFPSEDAYANWMYAARYAGDENFEKLLEEGLERFPANPVLLYLATCKTHGSSKTDTNRMYLERSVALDKSYLDPWFSLVIEYMSDGDLEQMDVALKKLLTQGAIAEEVMDYSYNMLAGLEKDAILVTNGDNDTYPGWILTRLLGHRPDVMIVNRSLLNTDWYPPFLIKQGAPRFITGEELTGLRQDTKPPYSDTLIERLVNAAVDEKRPVCFSHTLYRTEVVERFCESGRILGLVTLVTPPVRPYEESLKRALDSWLEEYRTVGMDGWRLRYAKASDAGRMLMLNYPASLKMMLGDIKKAAPEYLGDLFGWYLDHCEVLLTDETLEAMDSMWCEYDDIPVIGDWCRRQGYK